MKNNAELSFLVNSYIDLQLKFPIAIDEKEPKLYTKKDFDNFKSYKKIFSFSKITGKLAINQSQSNEEKIYSRTEFFTMCFNELTEDYNLEELTSQLEMLRISFLNYTDEIYPYIEYCIAKISSPALKNKQEKNQVKVIKK